MKESTPTSPLCLYPFSSLTVSPHGAVKLCTSARDKMGFVQKQSLVEIWQGSRLASIREAMISGQRISECSNCWRSEERKIPSRREKFYQSRVKSYGISACFQAFQAPKLMHLDISFSNLCNLHCVTCSSEYSSSWHSLDAQATKEGISFRHFSDEIHGISRMNEAQIREVVDFVAPTLRSVIIKGGEPLLSSECLLFLRLLCEHGRSDLSVFIQTNGTVMNKEILELVSELGANIGFSIDGFGEVYRWIRGYDFEKVKHNLELVLSSSGVGSVSVDFTTSAFNFYHLPDFMEFMRDFRFKNPSLESCFLGGWANQNYLTALVFAREDRASVIGRLDSIVSADMSFFRGYQELREMLSQNQLEESALKNFRQWLEFCNRMRKQDLQALLPQIGGAL